jgi:hypothetical protein
VDKTVTEKLFYPVIAVQLLLFVRGIRKKDNHIVWFAVISAALTLLILGLMEFKVHHFLRHNYSIPNTAVYTAGFAAVLFFIWNFREVIISNNYYPFYLGGAMWVLSGIIDLLTDAGIIAIPHNDTIETLLIIAGTLFLLIFYITVLIKTFSFKKTDSVYE